MMIFITVAFVCCLVTVNSYNVVDNLNACIDGCGKAFETEFVVDLKTGSYTNVGELIEVVSNEVGGGTDGEQCSRNVLLKIPFFDLDRSTIVKVELDYGDKIKGNTFHFGVNEEEHSSYHAEVYSNDTNVFVYKNSQFLCERTGSVEEMANMLLLNESKGYLYTQQRLVIYLSNNFVRIDDIDANTTQYYKNENLFDFLKTASTNSSCVQNETNSENQYLFIGLNRLIGARDMNSVGVCSARISFIDCYSNSEPDMDINVKDMNYVNNANFTMQFVHDLSYLEPTPDHAACSGEGVVRLRFDPNGSRKIARFDLQLGDSVSGFTFNIGDSPTNNGYGGDSGSTSNSAETHSNDNRFYVWLNPKYCGDTLLYKIEYSVFRPHDLVTLFVSDQRLEMTNNRDYHEIFKSSYLYNLNNQNVTCNCFDTRCYPGVEKDDDLYFGINRVIGGTYRPGIGLCRVKISWLECKANVKRKTSNLTGVSKDENVVDTTRKSVGRMNVGNIETSETVTPVVDETSTTVEVSKTTDMKQDNTESVPVSSSTAGGINPCTINNKKNLVYHTYLSDNTKFIYCDQNGTPNIISCPINMKWSQYYLQCLEDIQTISY